MEREDGQARADKRFPARNLQVVTIRPEGQVGEGEAGGPRERSAGGQEGLRLTRVALVRDLSQKGLGVQLRGRQAKQTMALEVGATYVLELSLSSLDCVPRTLGNASTQVARFNHVAFRGRCQWVKQQNGRLEAGFEFVDSNEPEFWEYVQRQSKHEVAFNTITDANIDGAPCRRQIVVFTTQGCEYNRTSGGCSHCGFHFKSSPNVGLEDLRIQFDKVFDPATTDVEQIELLTQGSTFNSKEVPKEFLSYMAAAVCRAPSIRKVQFESRPEYITEENIGFLKETLRDKTVEVGIGLDSRDDFIRDYVLRKGYGPVEFEKAAAVLKVQGWNLLGYVLVKPFGLTEAGAIAESVETVSFVLEVGRRLGLRTRVALEPIFVAQWTELERLYEAGHYQVAWLWSIVEVVKRAAGLGTLFVGLDDEGLSKNRVAKNCDVCSERVRETIRRFNASQDPSELAGLGCACKAEWRNAVEREPAKYVAEAEALLADRSRWRP